MSTETTPPPPAKPAPTTIHSLFQLAEQAPVKYRVSFTFPPGADGKPVELYLRPLTGAERVEIEQYDVDNIVPPKWGPCPPDVAPDERPGDYNLKDPDYLDKRRKIADLFNAYLVDKCLGLGLPETREIDVVGSPVHTSGGTSIGRIIDSPKVKVPVTLEDKARWLVGESVEGLPENRLLRSYITMIINECHRLNYGRVTTDADF